MGNATSTNIIDQHINSSIEVLNTTIQDCSSAISSQQGLDIGGDNNVISGNVSDSFISADITCTQSAKVQNDITNKVNAKMKQMAKAILGALSLNPGSAKAKNVTKLSIALGTSIKNTFNQKCQSALTSNQVLRVTGSGNTIRGNTFKSVQKIVKNCVQTSQAVTAAKNDLETVTDQTAASEKKGIDLSFIIMIVLVVLGFAAAFYFKGMDLLKSPYFWIGVVVLIAAYIGLAFWKKWFPFTKKDGDSYYRGRSNYPTNQHEYTPDSGFYDPESDDYISYS